MAGLTEETWNEYLKRSKKWAIRMEYGLLHSQAYRDLNYGPGIKVLTWFYEKLRYEKDKPKKGKKRYRLMNDGEIDFQYREAIFRGLTPQKFRKALLELHRLGFIEVKKPGSSLKGDWTIFTLSGRWETYGTSNFNHVEFPKSVHWVNFGFGTKEKS
jgi:hypothetical protein